MPIIGELYIPIAPDPEEEHDTQTNVTAADVDDTQADRQARAQFLAAEETWSYDDAVEYSHLKMDGNENGGASPQWSGWRSGQGNHTCESFLRMRVCLD